MLPPTQKDIKKEKFVQQAAKKDFGILKKWTEYSLQKGEDFYEEIQKLIENEISKMLNQDFDRLIRFLYSQDISEKKVKAVFDGSFEDDVAVKLTQLYLERQLQKYQTRIEYDNSDEVGDW